MPDPLKPAPSLDEIKRHALELQQKMQTEGGYATSADDVNNAFAVPGFSSGTSALDEETGLPIGVPQPKIGGEAVVEPTADQLGQQQTGIAAREAAAEAAAETPQLRNERGQFKAETPQNAAPVEHKKEAAAEAAAENIAEEAARNWDDYAEVDYEDDSGAKYTVWAKKDEVPQVRNGYARRSIMDRQATYLGRAKPVIERMIQAGTFAQVLPLIERAVNDPEYGQFVVDAYNRRLEGKPLTQAQAAAADAVAAVAQPAQAPVEEFQDPWLANTLKPLRSELEETRNIVKSIAERDRQQQEAVAQAERTRYDAQQMVMRTHNELSHLYPDAFSGNFEQDRGLLQQIHTYALNSGYPDAYGYTPAMYRLAFLEMRQGRPGSESPAAQTINRAAEIEAAASRRQVPIATGTPAPAPPAPKRAPKQPQTRDSQGRMKSAREFAEEVVKGLR